VSSFSGSGAARAIIRQGIPLRIPAKAKRCGLAATERPQKGGQRTGKILFSINKLSDFAHHEDVRTDSNAKSERDFAMARAAVKAKAKTKRAKKPAAKKRKARR